MVAGRGRQFITLSLCSKSHPTAVEPAEDGDRVDSPAPAEAGPASRRKRTLLSFQGPSLRDGAKKAPTRARGLRTCGFPLAGNPPKALRFRSFAGTFPPPPLGQRGKCSRVEACVKRLHWAERSAVSRLGEGPPPAG